MKPFSIDCKECDVEFDGAEDGPKVIVIFCDLHKQAESMARLLRMLRDNALRDGQQFAKTMITDLLEKAGFPGGEVPSEALSIHRSLCGFYVDQKPCPICTDLEKADAAVLEAREN